MTTPRVRQLTLAVLVLLLACSCAAPARAGKVVVVVANRVVLADLDDSSLPTVTRMLREGSIALVSPNCSGPKSEESVILTAGAGSSCRGGDYVGQVYDADEPVPGDRNARDAYRTRTGRIVPEGSAVFLGLPQALRESVSCAPAVIGALGESFRRAGKTTAAVGNADAYPDTMDRSAAVLAMDSSGRIDLGWVTAPGESTYHDSAGTAHAERGFFSDTGRLQEVVLTSLARADFVVVSFGDTRRLDEYKIGLSDKAYATHKRAVLESLDSMLQRILAAPEAKGATIVLLSLSPPVNGSWVRVTPMVVFPSKASGLLRSATTRTPGVIAASDFAPTMLAMMDVSPSVPMTGRAAVTVASDTKMATLREIDTRVTTNRTMLTPLAWVLAAIGGLTFTVSALVVGLSLKASPRLLVLLRAALVVCSSIGLAMLLAALAPAGPVPYAVAAVGFAVIISCLAAGVGSVLRARASKNGLRAAPIVAAYALTVAAILADAVMGGRLCRFAGPSSYHISGFRYYGIGNEYAALLIFMGGLLVLFSGDRARRVLAPVLGALTVLTLGVGSMGANYGSTFAATVTYCLICVVVYRKRFGFGHAAAAVAAGFALVGVFALLDWWIAGAAGSHAGRVAGTIQGLSSGAVPPTVSRKLLMNLRLTSGANALRLYAIFTPLLVLWFWGVQRRVREALSGDRVMMPGLNALWVGAAAAYLANDSGVVMVTVMMAMTVLVLLYSVLEGQACRE